MSDFIAPRYRVIAIDETQHWNHKITAITGRIAGVYIVNFAEMTHICSLRGSYWAEFVCNITEHYIREPDGHDGGDSIWPDDDAESDGVARGKALEAVWNGPFYGLQYEGGESCYIDEGFPEPTGDLIDVASAGWDENPDDTSDPDEYRQQRDQAAQEAVAEYMANGEEWEDIAPWKK
jgi:hypothetical protein